MSSAIPASLSVLRLLLPYVSPPHSSPTQELGLLKLSALRCILRLATSWPKEKNNNRQLLKPQLPTNKASSIYFLLSPSSTICPGSFCWQCFNVFFFLRVPVPEAFSEDILSIAGLGPQCPSTTSSSCPILLNVFTIWFLRLLPHFGRPHCTSCFCILQHPATS